MAHIVLFSAWRLIKYIIYGLMLRNINLFLWRRKVTSVATFSTFKLMQRLLRLPVPREICVFHKPRCASCMAAWDHCAAVFPELVPWPPRFPALSAQKVCLLMQTDGISSCIKPTYLVIIFCFLFFIMQL